MTTLPESVHPLLDGPEFATLATIEPGGRPQLSVVWFKRDGDQLLFSTVRGRRKALNLERDPRATVLVYAAGNPYHYVELRGGVSVEDDPRAELIDELSRSYRGAPWKGDAPGSERVIVRLTPTKVVVH